MPPREVLAVGLEVRPLMRARPHRTDPAGTFPLGVRQRGIAVGEQGAKAMNQTAVFVFDATH